MIHYTNNIIKFLFTISIYIFIYSPSFPSNAIRFERLSMHKVLSLGLVILSTLVEGMVTTTIVNLFFTIDHVDTVLSTLL